MLVCAGFAARAVAAYVEADRLIVFPSGHSPVTTKPTPPPALVIDPDVISERNIFCSECGPVHGPGPSSSYTGHPAVLIATSLGTTPYATVRVIPTEAQGVWGLDETIPGVGKITRIGGGSIEVVDPDGHSKQISLFETAAGPGDAATSPKGPAAAPSPFAEKIKKLSDGSYEVDRDVVRELVSAAGKTSGVRAMPVMKGKEITGMRFYGVKPDSVAAAIGLKSSDILSSVDNEPIKTAQQLLDLYSKLDKLGGVELQGTRAGKPLSIQLRFR
ncbi:MAG: hypothetical protein ABI867_16795 [Kofleriaceae bacterium]